jgi:hypothetical protein
MIRLILLILLLLFFNDEIFSTNQKSVKSNNYLNNLEKTEPFMSGLTIAPFNEDEYNLWNPDFEYYFDKTGRKGTLFSSQDITINEIPKIKIKKFDNVNSILNKLELYPPEIYNSC